MHGSSTARVDEQLGFVCAALPDPPARVLDAGCGEGRLAAALQERGFEVVGIDPDPEVVSRAADRGVRAVVTDLETYDDPVGFDAVVFSKSLHHVPELPAAMDKVRSLLTGSGVLVVDEFAHDDADAATAALFYGLRDLLEAAGVVVEAEHQREHGHAHEHGHDGEHGHDHADVGTDPLERWRAAHDHDPPLHGGEAMLDQLRHSFELDIPTRGPYLWSYLSEKVEDSPRGHRATVVARELEDRLIGLGAVRPLGLRVVGRCR